MIPVIIAIIAGVAVGIAIAGVYNNLVTLRNRMDNAWRDIDAQLQRRIDLIPSLAKAVEGHVPGDDRALAAVLEAHAELAGATAPEQKVAADDALSDALRQLLADAKGDPDLAADACFQQLKASIEDTESRVSYARMSYGDCVLAYNRAVRAFPGSLFAGIFQFKERTGFETPAER